MKASSQRSGKTIATHRPVESLIRVIRGQKVMLDSDLAELYGVPTKEFNQAVRRNMERFPEDFMFQLTQEESAILRSQIVTASKMSPKSFDRPNRLLNAARRFNARYIGSDFGCPRIYKFVDKLYRWLQLNAMVDFGEATIFLQLSITSGLVIGCHP